MEYLVGALFIFLFFGFIPYQVFKTAREKAKYKGSSGDTLRRSELEALIQNAVDEATGPFRKRIETLEAIVTDPDEHDENVESRVDQALLLEDPHNEDEDIGESPHQRARA